MYFAASVRGACAFGGLARRERPGQQSETSVKVQSTGERRATPRLRGPLPAIALDMHGGGQLGVHAAIDNLSAGGFYLRTARAAEVGESLMVVTKLAQAVVVLRGTVLRVERREDGASGLAVAVKQHQIFSLTDWAEKQRRVPSPPGP